MLCCTSGWSCVGAAPCGAHQSDERHWISQPAAAAAAGDQHTWAPYTAGHVPALLQVCVCGEGGGGVLVELHPKVS